MSNKGLKKGQKVVGLNSNSNIIVEDGHYKHISADGKNFIQKEFKPGHGQAHEITEEGELKQALQSTKVGMYV